MIKELYNTKTTGPVKAIASKSEVHRYLICAALSDKETKIVCENTNADIIATARCLTQAGADICYENGVFTVKPITNTPENAVYPCNESGSTLRFLLPLIASYGKGGIFETRGRLSERPLSPLKEELERAGAEISIKDKNIVVSGRCNEKHFTIPGNISSQFISGLMFMLTLTGGSITLTNTPESRPYIDMTADALGKFGCNISIRGNIIEVPKAQPLISPVTVESTGDWSNAAFFITAGIIGKKPITVTGLDLDSLQGDKKIVEILRDFGGKITTDKNKITAYPSLLSAINIDAKDIPDLVPVLSVAAANAEGTTRIYGCSRLRIKESDRIEAVKKMITALGGRIATEDDDIIIEGFPLSGGRVNSENDHRIAMSAAIASFSTTGKVIIDGADAVNKSYPSFWDEIR